MKKLDLGGIGIVAVLFVLLFVMIIMAAFSMHQSYQPQASEYNYARITSGMNVAQVTEIVGEGEIHFADNRMIVMKYTSPGVEIRVIFVGGVVYQKSLEQDGIVTSQDGEFIKEL
jgi:hypothetical protein